MLFTMKKANEVKPSGAVLVPLAEGFEEVEAVAIIDVLRRAGVAVKVAGLTGRTVTGSHGIALQTDCTLDEIDSGSLAMIVLPGGQPGTNNLERDPRVIALVRELEGSGRRVGAICAAPKVLAAAGILEGRAATSHPGVRKELRGARVLDEPRVVRAGKVITSQGPGTALEFALAIVADLCGEAQARDLAGKMLVEAPAPR
jgi:4-methyl-5(b-hydroxyethyl)-thiazole monophosphate biosynthesis